MIEELHAIIRRRNRRERWGRCDYCKRHGLVRTRIRHHLPVQHCRTCDADPLI